MQHVTTVTLLEREHELEQIHEAMGFVVSGRGRCIVFQGPPGIGKSCLLEAAGAIATSSGLDVLGARAGELERDYPFGTVTRLLEARLRKAGNGDLGRLLRGRAKLARPLLEGMEEVEGDGFSLIHGLYWLLVNLSEDAPLAVIVDDAHWADERSQAFLAYLARRLEDLPILLLIAARVPEADDETRAFSVLVDGNAEVLKPALLSHEAVGTLLGDALPEVASRSELVQAARECTGGNPFLVHELARSLQSSPQTWGQATADELAAFASQAVSDHVVRRLARLGAEALALARACATLSPESSMVMAMALSDLQAPASHAAIHRLVSRGILNDSERVKFTHPVIRSAVYSNTPIGIREELHLRAARQLHRAGASDGDVAAHLMMSALAAEPWCSRSLREVARSAVTKGAPDTAVRYLRRALQFSRDAAGDQNLLVELGLAEAAAGETTSLCRFEEALRGVGDDLSRARTYYALGQTLHRYGRHGEAVEAFGRGAALFQEDDWWRLRFEAGVGCASNYVASSRHAAIERLERVAEPFLGRPGTGSPGERAVLAALSLQRALVSADVDGTESLALKVVSTVANDAQDLDDIALPQAVAALVFCGNASAAEVAVLALIARAQDNGVALAFAEAKWLQTLVLHNLGRVDEARAAATESIDMTRAGWSSTVPAPHAYLIDCLIDLGDIDAAELLLQTAQMAPVGPEASGLNAWFYWARGRLRMVQRQPEAALEDFLAAGRALEPFLVVNPAVLPWRSQAATAAHAIGDAALANALVDEEVDLARACGRPGAVGVALCAKSLVADRERRLEFSQQAVEHLRSSDRSLELARALLTLGRWIRLEGRTGEAREPLREALDLADRNRAGGLAQHARGELLATGAKPRRAAVTGTAALTASEKRIARLAATGLSNREIAEDLFLTRNTVETHLRHAYRKLQITSREHLAAALAGD